MVDPNAIEELALGGDDNSLTADDDDVVEGVGDWSSMEGSIRATVLGLDTHAHEHPHERGGHVCMCVCEVSMCGKSMCVCVQV